MNKILKSVNYLYNSHSKKSFIYSLPKDASLLDAGCGNNAPYSTKKLRSDIWYVGLDVQDYNNPAESINAADEYLLTTPEKFADRISSLGQRFDAVISRHNLEHCNKPIETLDAICSVIKRGGSLFLAFPSEKSVDMPLGRMGTLNYYDDPTHVYLPVYNDVISRLKENGMAITYAAKQSREFFPFLRGLFSEPISFATKRVLPGTWALYGFETVIWAEKRY